MPRQRRSLEKDYSKYFEHVYQPPSLEDAKKRGKEAVNYHHDFTIEEKYRGLGKGRKYYIRTYGCQMNEHDTEVMAGIFEALDYTATNDVNDADVILLNTCAIRENAENKVFGEIGNLKHLKLEKPDVLIGVCGCMSRGICRQQDSEILSERRYDLRDAQHSPPAGYFRGSLFI